MKLLKLFIFQRSGFKLLIAKTLENTGRKEMGHMDRIKEANGRRR